MIFWVAISDLNFSCRVQMVSIICLSLLALTNSEGMVKNRKNSNISAGIMTLNILFEVLPLAYGIDKR